MQRGSLLDAESGAVVVAHVLRTTNPWDRLRGLIGRPPPGDDEGLLLDPCGSIHTAFMAYAIDAVHLDHALTVTRVVTALEPWRASFAPGARLTLELAAGSAARHALVPGRRLRWQRGS